METTLISSETSTSSETSSSILYDHYLLNALPSDILMTLSPSCLTKDNSNKNNLSTVESSFINSNYLTNENNHDYQYVKACKFLSVGFMGWEFCHEGLTHQVLIFQVFYSFYTFWIFFFFFLNPFIIIIFSFLLLFIYFFQNILG